MCEWIDISDIIKGFFIQFFSQLVVEMNILVQWDYIIALIFIITCQNSFTGYKSRRHKELGCLFIRCFVTTMYKHAANRDIVAIAKIVSTCNYLGLPSNTVHVVQSFKIFEMVRHVNPIPSYALVSPNLSKWQKWHLWKNYLKMPPKLFCPILTQMVWYFINARADCLLIICLLF